MNSTSLRSRLVRIAARSFGFSSTGPEVWRRLTPSSVAMMWLSVVLPSPGGPNSSTWSSASPPCRADEDLQLLAGLGLADIVAQVARTQRALERLFLRRLPGCPHRPRRGGFTQVVGLNAHAQLCVRASARQGTQRELDAVGHRHVGRQVLQCGAGFAFAVAQC